MARFWVQYEADVGFLGYRTDEEVGHEDLEDRRGCLLWLRAADSWGWGALVELS